MNAWKAALHILAAPTLRDRTSQFCDFQLQRIKPAILDEPWSTGQRLLIEIAMSFLSRDCKVCLYDGIGVLDPNSVRRVCGALTIAYGLNAESLMLENLIRSNRKNATGPSLSI